jgi:hypothetical protein
MDKLYKVGKDYYTIEAVKHMAMPQLEYDTIANFLDQVKYEINEKKYIASQCGYCSTDGKYYTEEQLKTLFREAQVLFKAFLEYNNYGQR